MDVGVRSWLLCYVVESPHKDRSIRMCVCYICWSMLSFFELRIFRFAMREPANILNSLQGLFVCLFFFWFLCVFVCVCVGSCWSGMTSACDSTLLKRVICTCAHHHHHHTHTGKTHISQLLNSARLTNAPAWVAVQQMGFR